jgi:hypothetical protein
LKNINDFRMKRVGDIGAKVVVSLLLVMPIFGAFGIFPAPTADMYNTPEAFAFIQALMTGEYIMILDAIVFALALWCLWTKRVALAALLLLPITVNIVAFHWFLDGGPFTGGAVMGNVLLVLNAYFLWQSKEHYRTLLQRA